MQQILVRTLFSGAIDIVGDIHGEIDALRTLMALLGYDAIGVHPQGRRLVFIGDLTDRGPDSPAVIQLVADLVSRGRAQCVLGNHELYNLHHERALQPGVDTGVKERSMVGRLPGADAGRDRSLLALAHSRGARILFSRGTGPIRREHLESVVRCQEECVLRRLRGGSSIQGARRRGDGSVSMSAWGGTVAGTGTGDG